MAMSRRKHDILYQGLRFIAAAVRGGTLVKSPAELNSRFLLHLEGELGPSQRFGTKILAPFKGGVIKGPNLDGRILPGGGDWLTICPKGICHLDVRITIETGDKTLIFMSGNGRRVLEPALAESLETFDEWAALDPSSYYLRLAPIFETNGSQYQRLNGIVSVGVGRFTSDGIAFDLHEIL